MGDLSLNTADHWVTSFFGQQKCSKFIIEDDSVLLVNCPLQLLENINFKDHLGDALLESLQSFHKEYGCGINSFLYMWCVWNKGIKYLLRKGLTFSTILETLAEGLEYVISSMKEQEISLQFVLPSLYKYKKSNSAYMKSAAIDCLCDVNYNSKNVAAEAVKLSDKYNYNSMDQNRCLLFSYRLYRDISFAESSSRFFCSDTDQRITTIRRCLSVKSFEDTMLEREMSAVLSKISHGTNILISLIQDIWQRQVKNNSADLISFSKDKIVTIPIPGYMFSCSIVVDGIVIKSSYTLQDLSVRDKSKSYRTLLIGGSLNPNYVHLGFSTDVVVEKITNCISENDEIWLKKTIQTLYKLKVSALLVQGTVDKRLISILQGSIIIISHVPYSSLCKLAKSTCKNIVSYVENSKEIHVCSVIIEHLQLRNGLEDNENLLLVKVPGKFLCQSVIICHELLYVAYQLEHTFWHLISRLSNICTAEKLLPGGGQTEKFCVWKLQELNKKNCDENLVYKVEALNVLSDGFKQFANKIDMIETETVDEISKNIIYDDPISKTEGWKAALKLALLLSQMDTVIVNASSNSEKEDLYFRNQTSF